MAGWLVVGGLCSSLGRTCVLAWRLAVARVHAFVRMYKVRGLGWDGVGDGDWDDGLRIWAEQVEGTRRAGKPRLGELRWFSSG